MDDKPVDAAVVVVIACGTLATVLVELFKVTG
jgi:hypothetical protein